MEERRYVTPGWMAIIAASLSLPMIVLGIILDLLARKNTGVAAGFLIPYISVVLAQTVCGLYALGRLKTLLNERHGFHEVDSLIVAMIIGACILTLLGLSARISLVALGAARPLILAFLFILFCLGIFLSLLTIIFAVKLLRLESSLGGLLRPYAYVNIAAAICFATLILAPLGLLLDAGGNVMLGMIFLRRPVEGDLPDFV